MRRTTLSILALVVFVAGLICPCPQMMPSAVAADAGVDARAATAPGEHACCATRSTPADVPHAPPADHTPGCPHCDGADAVPPAPKHEKSDLLPPAVAIDWLAPLAVVSVPQLDVSSAIERSRSSVVHSAPPDRCALICTFLN